MASLDSAKRTAHHGGIITEVWHRARKRNFELEKNISNYDIPKLSELISNEVGFTKSYDGKKLIVTLADFDYTETHANFLINVVHKNNATTVIRDISDKSRNEVKPKTKDQGYETSCHLVIEFNRTRAGYYPFVYDSVPKLTIGKIESFFNALLLEVSKNNTDIYTVDNNGAIATSATRTTNRHKFKTRFTMTLTSDDDLLSKVKKSTLSKIQLVSHQTHRFNNIDRGEIIIPKKYIMEIEPSPVSSDNLEWFRNIARTDLGKQFDQIKFSYPTETGTRTAVVELTDVAMKGFETALTKKSLLSGFSSNLKDSYDNLQNDIIEKLISLGG